MNSGYGSSTGQKDDINLRKLAVRNMLLSREYRPHLVMIQEFRKGWRKADVLYEEPGVETISKYNLMKERSNQTTDVGILFDSDTLECLQEFGNIKHKLKQHSSKYQIEQMDMVMERMYVAKFGMKPQSEYKKARLEKEGRCTTEREFFVISWHGPHRGMSEEKKKLWLQMLIDVAYSLTETNNGIPFIIGGDFNLSAVKVKKWQKDNAFKSFNIIADAPVGRSKKDIDFIIISEGLMGTRCHGVSLDDLIPKPSRIMDTSPRYMEISLNKNGETSGDPTCEYRRTTFNIPESAVNLIEESEHLRDEVKGLKDEVKKVYQRLQCLLQKQKHK